MSIGAVVEYVLAHSHRGACTCGHCVDAPPNAEQRQPDHAVDLVFFKVAARGNPNKETFRALLAANNKGEFADVDPLDGKEHNYIELGGWLGDQGVALQFMGLGALLGIWRLLTPRSILGSLIDETMVKQLAGSGMVTIKADDKEPK